MSSTEGKVRSAVTYFRTLGLAKLTSDHHLQGCCRLGGWYVTTMTTNCMTDWAPGKPLSIETVEVEPPRDGEVRIKIL